MSGRICVFCGGAPVSNEDAWPVWLQPHLTTPGFPLVRGQVNQFRYDDQQLVATWATKTAMTLQFTPIYSGGPVIAPSLYRELHAHQAAPPPATVAVWLGHGAQQPPPGALFALRGLLIGGTDFSGLVPVRERYLGFEATMIVRHLVLKIMGHAGPKRIRIVDEVVPPPGLDRIWPVRVSGGILLPESR
jgi:hypothetical protein